MCWAKVKKIFLKTRTKTTVSTETTDKTNVLPTQTPNIIPPLTLPHPEEPPDYSQNLVNTSYAEVLKQWQTIYHVPQQYCEFWQTKVVVTITNDIATPAATWGQDGARHLAVKPEWLNPGVIAHEQAHNSYALLSKKQKAEFSAAYNSMKETEPLIQLLYSKNQYGLTNDIEGHAEVYRYLGEKMPEQLKKYYPKMF